MADAVLIDYVATLLRTKGTGPQTALGASVLADAASAAGLLDARRGAAQATALTDLAARAKSLAESKAPTAKAAGLRALTVFAAEGDRAAALSSLADWAATALGALRAWETQPDEVLDAAWGLLAAIFRRAAALLQTPGVRRDVAPLAARVAAAITQPAEKGRAPSPAALTALHAALTAVPASFKQHLKALEPVVAAAALGPRGGAPAAISALAALPRAAGDAEGWTIAAQRLLATAHALLDAAYLRLEPPALAAACASEGRDPSAAPLVDAGAAAAGAGAVEAYSALFGQVDAAVRALEALLAEPFLVAVPLPAAGLLLLASRLLSVDADSLEGRAPAASTGKLAELCLQLPRMHVRACALLRTLAAAAGSLLTPLALSAARLVGEQLGKAAVNPAEAGAHPSVAEREGMYSTAVVVARAGGAAAARHLAPLLLQCASVELYGTSAQVQAAGEGAPKALTVERPRKKAKHAQHASDLVGARAPDNAGAAGEIAAMRAQAALLEVLEAVLEVGGALLPPAVRARADDVAAHAAATAFDAAQHAQHAAEGDAGPLAALQLAALRALLASALAPAGHRPPHLPLALALFRRGLRHQNGDVAAFSSHALLCCEALLHPRAVPRPAALRAADPSAGALGMPRFWAVSDAEAWAEAQRMAAAAAGGGGGGGEDMETDGDALDSGANGVFRAAPLSAGFLAPVAADKKRKVEAPVAAAPPKPAAAKKKAAKAKPAAKAKVEKTKKAVELKKPAPAAAKPVAPAPAVRAPKPAPLPPPPVEDESDDESLPDIDSGASSSDDE